MLTVTYHNVVKVKYTTMKMETMMTTAPTMTMTTQQNKNNFLSPVCFHNIQRDNFTSLLDDVLVSFCTIWRLNNPIFWTNALPPCFRWLYWRRYTLTWYWGKFFQLLMWDILESLGNHSYGDWRGGEGFPQPTGVKISSIVLFVLLPVGLWKGWAVGNVLKQLEIGIIWIIPSIPWRNALIKTCHDLGSFHLVINMKLVEL
jgi:hypothetical protein